MSGYCGYHTFEVELPDVYEDNFPLSYSKYV